MTAATDLWVTAAYLGYWFARMARAVWRATDPKRDREEWWVR